MAQDAPQSFANLRIIVLEASLVKSGASSRHHGHFLFLRDSKHHQATSKCVPTLLGSSFTPHPLYRRQRRACEMGACDWARNKLVEKVVAKERVSCETKPPKLESYPEAASRTAALSR